MNLFTRYFRINLLATIIIFILASLAFYFLLWYVSIAQMDEDLKIEQREIETYVQKYNHPPEPITVKDQNISFAVSGIRKKKISDKSALRCRRIINGYYSKFPNRWRELKI